MSKDEALRTALKQAYNLGQIYWQQADSEYISQHKKADQTEAKFQELLETTVAALETKNEPVANNWSVFNTGAEVWDKLSLADAVVELTPSRLERGWSAVCVINKDNPPLYIAPPQRKPLTDEEIERIWESLPFCNGAWETFARAIEAAHGIKGGA